MNATRRLRTIPAALGLAVLLGATAGACAGPSAGTGDASADAVVDDTTTPSGEVTAEVALPTEARPTFSGKVSGNLVVKAEPSDSAATVTTLKAKTPMGSTTTVLVTDERDGWLQVSLPVRPNGASGWVPAGKVELRANTVAVTVDRAAKKLVMTRDGEVELEAPIADGTKENPTPAGSFYVTDVIETGDAGGAYGSWAFGLSGHSETLTEFGGGDGQLGLHGTNEPGKIGQSVSHGCVRVTNDVAEKLSGAIGLGTPVTII
jgi:lipoprotein-anchoring transpeptidase ErfK/SrfK